MTTRRNLFRLAFGAALARVLPKPLSQASFFRNRQRAIRVAMDISSIKDRNVLLHYADKMANPPLVMFRDIPIRVVDPL